VKTLAELVANGAVLSTPDEYRAVLAAADFAGNILWFQELSGNEHRLEADEMRADYGWLRFSVNGVECAIIRPISGGESAKAWENWHEHQEGCEITCRLIFEDGATVVASAQSATAGQAVPIMWEGAVERLRDLRREAPANYLPALCRGIAETHGVRLAIQTRGKFLVEE
jgi:hypothetical protein